MRTEIEPYIETLTGNEFWFSKPVFNIDEIGHSLGNLCRFTGQCRRFYSVAEHSMLVGMLMEHFGLGDPFEGLMHDAHESVIGDVSSPLKSLLPGYRELEKPIERAMRIQFRLPEIKTDGCRFADELALLIEAKHMMVSRGKDYSGLMEGVREFFYKRCLGFKLMYLEPGVARDNFMASFYDLGAGRGFKMNVE